MSQLRASTPLTTLRFSPDVTVDVTDVAVGPQNVAEDNLAGAVCLVSIGSVPDGTHVVGYHVLPDGEQLLSFDTDVSLPGGVVARPGDVVRFDGATYALEFDATANGLPAGVMTDAIGKDGNDLLLSFDVSVALNGGSLLVDDEDVVKFDGSSFTMIFDGSAFGVPPELDLDAVDRLDNGHLLVSFDGSGTVGGVVFDDEDLLEFSPETATWELAYDGSVRHPALAAADLKDVAVVNMPLPRGDCIPDGILDIFDVLRKIDIILARVNPTPSERSLCDDDCDGDVDIFDVLLEIDGILGRISQPLTGRAGAALSATAARSAPRVTLAARSGVLRLRNHAGAVRALELTLVPEGGPVEVVGALATPRTDGFLVEVHQAEPTAPVKVVVVSLAGDAIARGSGAIARLQFGAGSRHGRLRLTEVRVARQ